MPVLKGNLPEAQMTKIRKNYKFLINELDGKFLVYELLQEEVFDFSDKEEIFSQTSRESRTDLLLTKLLHSGPYNAYDVFLKALREHYPHVAERLEEKCENEENTGQTQEIYNSTHTNMDIEERKIIFQELQGINNEWLSSRYPDLVPASSFNMTHLPDAFKRQEVLDCVHSLALQTVLAVYVGDLAKITPYWEGFGCWSYGSGRVWRVQRKFFTADNKSCPCNDCKGSNTPRKRWGEYIVLTLNDVSTQVESGNIRFVLGYDSDKKMSDVSVLKGLSVIRSDESLDFAEVLCITHDADTSKIVEDICQRNNFNREKLLNRCHLMQKDKKLDQDLAVAVLVSHPCCGPKHISVGEWLVDKGDKTFGSSRHVYTAAANMLRSGGGPVLLVDRGNASVTLHYRWYSRRNIGKSCGYVWSL